MKGKKFLALLMTVLTVCTVMPAAVFASVTDVDEGADSGITITNTYTSNITITVLEVDADGNTVKTVDEKKETISFALESEEGQAILSSLDSSMAALYEKDYILDDKTDSSEVHYSSQQVLNSDGDVIIVDDLDDLVNAYIANGKVTDNLQIDKYETYKIVYKVVKKAAAEQQDITTAEITGVTVDFKPGDKPNFTAQSAEPDLYYVYAERWSEVDGDKYVFSAPFFNRDEDLLITEFEAGKEYTYMVWLKPAEEYDADGNSIAYKTNLSPCRTVLINGESYTLTDDMVTDEGDAGIFLYTDLKISVSEQDTIEPDAPVTNPPAGDNSLLLIWAALAALVFAGAGVIGTLVFAKRKEA